MVGSGRLTIEEFAVLEPHVMIDIGSSDSGLVTIAARAKLKQGSVLRAYSGQIEIGPRVSLGEYSVLAGHGGLAIGQATIIAGHCYVAASGHLTTIETPIRFQGETAEGIVIGDAVWIGANVVIQDGVNIGDGAVIGAGSIVTRSMPANTICFGVPCRPVRQREAARFNQVLGR